MALKGPHERECCASKSRLDLHFVKKIDYGRRS